MKRFRIYTKGDVTKPIVITADKVEWKSGFLYLFVADEVIALFRIEEIVGYEVA